LLITTDDNTSVALNLLIDYMYNVLIINKVYKCLNQNVELQNYSACLNSIQYTSTKPRWQLLSISSSS